MAGEVFGFDENKLKVAMNEAINEAIKNIDVSAQVNERLMAAYPVGSIYILTVNKNPATFLGFGTWTPFGSGRTLMGVNASDNLFKNPEQVGGSKDMQKHTHTFTAQFTDRPVANESHNASYNPEGSSTNVTVSNITGSGKGLNYSYQGYNTPKSSEDKWGYWQVKINGNTGSAGTGSNNLPPYITCYFFKRIA